MPSSAIGVLDTSPATAGVIFMSVGTVEAVVVVGRAPLAASACLDWPEMVNYYQWTLLLCWEKRNILCWMVAAS